MSKNSFTRRTFSEGGSSLLYGQINRDITGIEPAFYLPGKHNHYINISKERYYIARLRQDFGGRCGEYRSRTDDLLRARQAL